jgi:glycolate oxidase FAD binding subunit
VAAGEVVTPGDVDSLTEVMAAAATDRARVVVRGRGTKLDWGAPPSAVDVIVDVSALDAVLEHVAGDLVVRVQPGVLLADLAERLRPAGQRLVVGEMVPGSTVGGAIAAAVSGPLRLAYGGVRDLVLGVTVVLADGTVARSGGKVVKNVAGYDLGKLFTGSYGTLGVIAEAVFRLHPVPDTTTWVTATYPGARAAGRAAARVLSSQVVPAAMEVDRPAPDAPVTVAVLLEGSATGCRRRAEQTAGLLAGDGDGGSPAAVAEEAPEWWGRLPGATVIKVTCGLASVPAVIEGLPLAVRASAGSGVVYGAVPAATDAGDLAGLITGARRLASAAGGFAVVLGAPGTMKQGVDVWGPAPGFELMRRVKEVFDPDRRLAPGRFVGGL